MPEVVNTYQHKIITALTSKRQITFPKTLSAYKKSVWLTERRSDLQTGGYLRLSVTDSCMTVQSEGWYEVII